MPKGCAIGQRPPARAEREERAAATWAAWPLTQLQPCFTLLLTHSSVVMLTYGLTLFQ